MYVRTTADTFLVSCPQNQHAGKLTSPTHMAKLQTAPRKWHEQSQPGCPHPGGPLWPRSLADRPKWVYLKTYITVPAQTLTFLAARYQSMSGFLIRLFPILLLPDSCVVHPAYRRGILSSHAGLLSSALCLRARICACVHRDAGVCIDGTCVK
jgi:hypothetical protein